MASLDFHDCYDSTAEIVGQHYAFLVDEDGFDDVFARLRARGQQRPASPLAGYRSLPHEWPGGSERVFSHRR